MNEFKLLIVDDDPIFNQHIQSFLCAKGVAAISVFTLNEARAYLQQQHPDFILLDYLLVDEMGIELMVDITRMGLTMPVMMITADDDQDTMQHCFERGVDDYLLKPLNFELLWLKIQRLSASQGLQMQVAKQALMVQTLLDEKHNEEALARHVYEYMSNQGERHQGLVKSLLKSSKMFNGDTLIATKSPNGNTAIILMDATGHGLAAAISVLPLASVFNAMVDKGLALSTIVYELNRKLSETIPDDRFVAAILIEIDKQNRRLNIWNGGMPDVYLLDESGNLHGAYPSKNMPLGILSGPDFDVSVESFDISQGGHLVLCSDGLLEQEAADKRFFGKDKLKAILAQSRPENFIASIESAFSDFIGDEVQADDVSVCHVDINHLFTMDSSDAPQVEVQPGSIHMSLNLQGTQLRQFDVMQCLDVLMTQTQMPMELRQKSFTVCAELLANAIEHGILGLQSSLKSEDNGFIKFLDMRNQRMQQLNHQDGISLTMAYDTDKTEIAFTLSDSGDGYDPDSLSLKSATALSGRGLKLVKSLSQRMQYVADTNQTSVIIK